jgi:hypothetical protein
MGRGGILELELLADDGAQAPELGLAARVRSTSSSGLERGARSTVTGTSAGTVAKLPLAMPNGKKRPPGPRSADAARPTAPPTPSKTTSTVPAASRTRRVQSPVR